MRDWQKRFILKFGDAMCVLFAVLAIANFCMLLSWAFF
jgi:hypothetical protein